MQNQNYSTMKVDRYNNIAWRNSQGNLHRIDGPALVWANGYKAWYQNGKQHRADGPAVIYPNGTKEWHYKGIYLGDGNFGFWKLWDLLIPEERQNWKLHQWMSRNV